MTKTEKRMELDRARLNLGERELCVDPVLGTRDGWRWCSKCQGHKPAIHVHGDPLEDMTREDLLRIVRVLTAKPRARR